VSGALAGALSAAAAFAGPSVSFRQSQLAWASRTDDERRFHRLLGQSMGAAVGFSLLVALWTVPPLPQRAATVPDLPVARLVLPPPEPPPVRTTPPAAPAVPAPAPAAVAPPAPTERPATRPPAAPRGAEGAPASARNPRPDRPPGDDLASARQRASGVGLLAARDQLAALHTAPAAVQLQQVRAGPGVGTGSGPGVGAGTDAGLPARALITASVSDTSGGVASAGFSRNSGGGGLAGRGTTLVEGAAGGGGGGGAGTGTGSGRSGTGPGAGPAGSGSGAGGGGRGSPGGKPARSVEEIRLVFERHKGAIYALYQRALREDTSLQGKVVLELRIEPSGQVTALRVVSSDLKAPELEGRLAARVRQFDFGAKDVGVMVVTWPVDFLPS
jgi:outer membrane biosynthesis protein TonB